MENSRKKGKQREVSRVFPLSSRMLKMPLNQNSFICTANVDISLSQQPKDSNIGINNKNSQK